MPAAQTVLPGDPTEVWQHRDSGALHVVERTDVWSRQTLCHQVLHRCLGTGVVWATASADFHAGFTRLDGTALGAMAAAVPPPE
jgi:hypothetical protein